MFTRQDRALLQEVARKLDISIQVGIADLNMERRQMATQKEIKDAVAAILVKANAEQDETRAVAGIVADIKAQNAQLLEQLATANQNDDPEEAASILAQLQQVNNALDADSLAKAAILGGVTPPVTNPDNIPSTPGTPNPVGEDQALGTGQPSIVTSEGDQLPPGTPVQVAPVNPGDQGQSTSDSGSTEFTGPGNSLDGTDAAASADERDAATDTAPTDDDSQSSLTSRSKRSK